ncbi:MAG: MMPL family transporter [Kofleriaceae bacterium]
MIGILRARWIIIAIYAVLLPLAVIEVTRIPNEGALDKLIVPTDPDLAATRAFQKIFPEPQLVMLMVEAPDPWSPDALAKLAKTKQALAGVPHLGTFSVIDALHRARPQATPDEIKRLALGTPFFTHQGLVGPHHLTLIVSLDVHTPDERDHALEAIERRVDPDVRAVGAPLVTSWLEHQSSRATSRSFAIFGVLLVLVTWFLYRSVRALFAIVIALGTSVALGVAAGGLLGFSFTIVSALVPLTIMVTTLATLTYLHSRFVDQPDDVPLEQHHVAALRNKLLPVTGSTIAAAGGFAALSVSHILPIRHMGLWVALGLVIAWIVAYTLFPALQRVLQTPTNRRVQVRSRLYDRIVDDLPQATYRYRWPIVVLGLALCGGGVFAFRHMNVHVDALSNLDPDTKLYRDMEWFQRDVMDLNIARVWIHLPKATATEPETLTAIDHFQTTLETLPNITGVAGPVTPIRMRSYLSGSTELNYDDVETLLMTEPDLRTFIDVGLKDYQIDVLFENGDAAGYRTLVSEITTAWNQAHLDGATMRVVGESLLQVKIGADLVPTLAESFALTAAFIFIVFIAIFRSGWDRILAMLPSLFALLVTFLGLRIFGGGLNVATIIIATTILGTTENDQLHFFHHMHEKAGQPIGVQLRHALRVSGRAIVFATMINAIGFLGLATSAFPPLRQFGLLTSSAFVLALIGDFTILPAALWILRRAKVGQSSRA